MKIHGISLILNGKKAHDFWTKNIQIGHSAAADNANHSSGSHS